MPKQAKTHKPVHEVRMGRIRAAIWENETANGVIQGFFRRLLHHRAFSPILGRRYFREFGEPAVETLGRIVV